jgi:hypothetical protein
MRDIRSDLQERATLIDDQIRAAVAHYEKTIQQLQTERDARIADLKSGLAMLAKFMEFEERFLHNTAPVVPPTPLVALADLFMKKLNDAGQMSKQELIDMAIKEGFFPDAETTAQGAAPNACHDAKKRAYSRSVRRNLHAPHIFPNDQTSTGGLVHRGFSARSFLLRALHAGQSPRTLHRRLDWTRPSGSWCNAASASV